jgi:hypothetical protein
MKTNPKIQFNNTSVNITDKIKLMNQKLKLYFTLN